MASLMALDLKPGDEVITPAFGFPAAVEMMCILNIRPVLIDVNWNTCKYGASTFSWRFIFEDKGDTSNSSIWLGSFDE